jgi:hypothetical protein
MVPWSVCLLRQLPRATTVSGWNIAWAGLDLMEAAGLAGTGVLLARGDERYRLCAAATAALLLTDAWFDVVTAASGNARAVAIAMAVGAELPTAALCAALAVRNRADDGGSRDHETAHAPRPRSGRLVTALPSSPGNDKQRDRCPVA